MENAGLNFLHISKIEVQIVSKIDITDIYLKENSIKKKLKRFN
jgi:hypothetical protein